ncbi:MAG: carboxypeptidase regulatory-like domain-containing protein [Acidobacteriota bacterium]
MRTKTIGLFCLALLVGSAALAHAQVKAAGNIQGSVVDADGAALPGVQVTVSGEALIGRQTAFSGSDGSFRVPLLPPGTYRVAFELQGFATVVQESVVVGVRRTATMNVTLQLASVAETITVTARSPIVDVKSTKGSSEYSDELRNTLPETRGTGADLMALAPEASIPSGGNQASVPSFFGSPENSNAYQIDGVDVTDPGGGFQFPFYSPDFFETVELTSSGASAEYGKAMGGVFNVITKSGGNSFHGESNFFVQKPSFIRNNTDDIVSTIVDFSNPTTLDHRYDLTNNVGGPLFKDKAWFFVGQQYFDDSERNAGVPFDGTENSDRFLGKVTWQANENNRVIGSMMADSFTVGGRPNSPFFLEEATVFEPSINLTPNVTWDSVLSPNSFFEFKFSGFFGFFDLVPVSQGADLYEVTTGIYSGAYWGQYAFDRGRTNVQGNLSYFAEDFAGDHSFKFGAEFERNVTDDKSFFGESPSGLNGAFLTYLGEPYFAYTFEPNLNRNSTLIKVTTLYGQDDWTMNLGLRWDRWDIGFLGGNSRPDEPTFNDIAPRVGVTLDLFGDGKTAISGFFGRFYEEAHGSAFDNFDPGQADLVGLVVNPDFTPAFEAFRVSPTADLAIDPGLTNTFSRQFSAGVDHQLTEDLAFGVKYIHKDDEDIFAGEDQGSTFVPVQVTTVDGNPLTIFAGAPFDPFRVLVNDPVTGNAFRDYDAVQIKATKRLSNNWSLITSLLIQKADGNVSNTFGGNLGSTGGFDSPNDFVNTPGELPNSRRYSFKAQGSWLLPDPIRTLVGFQFDAARSARFTRLQTFPSSVTGGVPFADRTVPIEKIGDSTINNFYNLNLRAEKKFQMPNNFGDIGVVLDIFNLTNQDGIRNIFLRVPNFNQATAVQSPRTFRLGFRWLF